MKTKQIIINYFKDSELKVLDKDSKGVWGAFPGKQVYGAVSLNYLHKYLLKEKVTIKFVAKTIAELCKEKFLLPLPCNFAGDLVFCNYNWALNKSFCKFSFVDNKVKITSYYESSMFKEKINIFNSYLK